eukprot:CAMPEP_0168197066 /NCGR_PEP_ID=MMETSP0139_2-20121125/20922_1 /TAXON_ID=44445 /ORGANISM="Pseudo-nitzschia australis, Strain 10249 10 AB" /LENGTH=1040 /DNA_ID=CAMNT_0008121425 /DNA_START=219 /DNA_END=3341 /DNA_ORIENTATION=-
MWKLAQRSLLQGKAYRSIPLRCTLVSNTTITRGTGEQSPRNRTRSTGSSKQQHEQQRHHLNHNSSDRRNADRLFQSSRAFLEKSSSPESAWTIEHLEIANKILHAWSRQTIPSEMQSSWIPIAEKLISTSLDQFKMVGNTNKESSPTILMPDSDVFCTIITMYSKSNLPNSAERADYWLQRMIHSSKLYPDRVAPPRPTIFANVLSAWEKSKLPGAEFRAQKLWMQLKSTKGLTPTSSAYYLYISLWSKSNLPEAAEIGEQILREMLQEGKRNPKLLPSCPVFVNVISSWRKRKEEGDNIYTQRAQAVLDLLVTEYVRRSRLPQKWMRFSINDIPFNSTIQAWATSSLAPQLIEERINDILKTMDTLEVSPTMVTTWSALPMYSPVNSIEQSATVQDVPAKLLRLLDSTLSNDGRDKDPVLRNQIFTKALEICSTYSGNVSEASSTAGDVAEEILLNKYFKRPRGERRVATTISGFEHAIKAWRYDNNHNREYKEKRMTELIEKMEKEVDHIYMHTHKKNPSAGKLYASLAKAWTMSYYPNDAQERAEKNIDRLLACCKYQPESNLNLFYFLDIMEAARENFSEQVAADFMRKIYIKLLANDSQFYRMMKTIKIPQNLCRDSSSIKGFLDGVLDTLISSSGVDSGRRAETILLKQQELYEEGICSPPTFDTFKKVLRCWSNSLESSAPDRMENMLLLAQSLHDAGDSRLRPDFDGYMTVITALSKSQNPDAPYKIQSHLKNLHRRRVEGDQTFRIDSRVYAALIRAYANSDSDNAQAMANTIFQSAPDDLKDTALYNALIEAQGGDSNRAEEFLQVMHLSYSEGNDIVKPNTETFNGVIQSWLRSGSPMAAWRADGIFKRMVELSNTGKLDVKPNSRTFDLVISTLAQDWGAELAQVDAYLALLKEHYRAGDCVPTVTSYTEAIRAWAFKDDDPRAILRAQALLDEMHELAREGVNTVRPNRSTYQVYLEGLCQSSVHDRTHLVNDVLFKMRENKFDLDDAMRSSIQRCLLPVSSRANTWIIDVDEYINPQNEWMHVTTQ